MKILSEDREEALAKEVIAVLRREKWCLATAESCTTGMLATLLSHVDGSGSCFHGGIVAYSKEMKQRVLGVSAELLSDKTAVCAEVAESMATGAIDRTSADAAIAVTGVAGPDPDEDDNPVGLVFVAAATPTATGARELNLGSQAPEAILSTAASAAFELFLETAGLTVNVKSSR